MALSRSRRSAPCKMKVVKQSTTITTVSHNCCMSFYDLLLYVIIFFFRLLLTFQFEAVCIIICHSENFCFCCGDASQICSLSSDKPRCQKVTTKCLNFSFCIFYGCDTIRFPLDCNQITPKRSTIKISGWQCGE